MPGCLPAVVFLGNLVEGGVKYIIQDASSRNVRDIKLALKVAKIEAFVKIVAKYILRLPF